mmetsp:Transcript_39429/g.61459  ORF Transcript_39429/g.61459 Transcript_39429/m.61459 type:complete len:354 (+) Transcript_39429:2330-3391(+)
MYKLITSLKTSSASKKFTIKNYRGHLDSISSLQYFYHYSDIILSASFDGFIRFWQEGRKNSVHLLKAHQNKITSVIKIDIGKRFISCSEYGEIKLWKLCDLGKLPIITKNLSGIIKSIDCEEKGNNFVSSGEKVLLWDLEKFIPIQKVENTSFSTSSIKFNPLHHSILAYSGSDRSITISDLRLRKSILKVGTSAQNNQIAWETKNPWKFISANEDGNVYIFDMRNSKFPISKLGENKNSIQSIDFDPRTETLISGGLDGNLKIYKKTNKRFLNRISIPIKTNLYAVKFGHRINKILCGGSNGNLNLVTTEKYLYIPKYPKMINLPNNEFGWTFSLRKGELKFLPKMNRVFKK